MKNLLLWLVVMWSISACQKTEIEAAPTSSTGAPVNLTNPTQTFDATGQKLVLQGMFVNSPAHAASGLVKIYEKDGKRTLLFQDLKIDGGPDLRIYLAEDRLATGFVEVSSKVKTGDFFVELPATANPAKQKQVLVWCKAFSVLFGSAELK